MTSVPNHQPRLSGNSLWLCLLVILWSSCGLFNGKTKTPNPGRQIPAGQHPSDITEETDTLDIRPDGRAPIITDDTKLPSQLIPPVIREVPEDTSVVTTPVVIPTGEAINVALIMPFMGHKHQPESVGLYDKSKYAISYYAGFKMGIDMINPSMTQLINLSVLDNEASSSKTQSLMTDPSIASSHVLIGGYRGINADIIAKNALTTGKYFVSPIAPLSTTTIEAPIGYAYQLNVDLETTCDYMINQAAGPVTGNQITVIVRAGDANEAKALEYLKASYKERFGEVAPPLNVMAVNEAEVIQNEFKMDSLSPILQHVFIIPSWQSPGFAEGVQRFISAVITDDIQIKTIGMQQWLEASNFDFALAERVNLHIPTLYFIDKNDPNVKSFIRSYYNEYGAFPDEQAYQGYDTGRYVFSNISKLFDGVLPDGSASVGLTSRYRLEKTDDEHIYHNTALQLIAVRNSTFIRVQ